MNADVFVDTNILLYTIDEDAASASKRQRSQQLLLTGALGMVGPGSSRVFCQRGQPEVTVYRCAEQAVACGKTLPRNPGGPDPALPSVSLFRRLRRRVKALVAAREKTRKNNGGTLSQDNLS